MASIRRRNSPTDQREGRSGWVVAWREPDGRQRRKAFGRKADAEAFATHVEHGMRSGAYLDPTAGKMTVGQLAAIWRRGQLQLAPSTAARYDSVLKNQILPTWERAPLEAVSYGTVQAWVGDLHASGLAPRSVLKAHMLLCRVLDLAVRERRIGTNPARGVELPRAKRAVKQFLTADRLADLADACEKAHPGHGLIVTTLGYTGLRFGELAALRVSDFDPLRRRLHIRRSVTDVDGRMVFGEPKTHQHREVPVPQFLIEELAAHLAAAGRNGDELIFSSPEGGVLRLNNFRRRGFDQGVVAVGLNAFTPHQLRHTAASLAVASGADVKAVQRMLGHASAAMTLDVYAGLFEDGLDKVAKAMNATATKVRAKRAARLTLVQTEAVG
jgi:integrase